jgi:M6 family metalloprotease-like protein
VSQVPVGRATRKSRALALLGSTLLLGSLLPFIAVAPVLAEDEPAGAAASGFLFFKYATPDPLCDGVAVGVTEGPFFTPEDCGRGTFLLSGASELATPAVEFIGADGTSLGSVTASFDAVRARWSYLLNPAPSWPAGWISAVVKVGGDEAGRAAFGYKLLGAEITTEPGDAAYAPGDDVPVGVAIGQLDNLTDTAGTTRTGVPATFELAVVTPAGERRVVPGGPITADAAGNATATIPGSLTADLEGDPNAGFEVVAALTVVDATYTDPATGAWAADEAGRTALTLLDSPDRLALRASFVSSVGWVKPGDSFPFRVFVTNAMTTDATNVSVSIPAPPSASFLDATPLNSAESASVGTSSITWNIGTIPAATEAGPMVRTLVVTAKAATLAQDAEVVWKDLSSTATLSYSGQPEAITSTTHGPKVIPPAGNFETARYGDKPFPMVPVEYIDLKRQSNATWDNDSEKLDTVVNDPAFDGSTFNLYQEMSYGQLFPHGTVPSAGIATASFSEYGEGFEFTTPDRTDPLGGAACRGATLAEAPATIGSPAFDTRIKDGWYQLPATTEYYGGDWPVFTATTLSIDSACGPLGKGVFDAAQIADPEIDYNQYDSDKDGVVDFFMLVFVGCGGNGPSQAGPVFGCPYFADRPSYDNIWPHSSSLEAQYTDEATGLRGYISDDQLQSLEEVPQCWTDTDYLQYDDCAANGGTGADELPVFVRVGPYNVNPETVFQSASVISHEYGHHLGLPDFYNNDGDVYADMNLMASDFSQHMTVFGKQDLGWVVPEFLQPGESVTVEDWEEIKSDTGKIHWERPDGTPYTLSAANGDQNIHNGEAFGVKLGGRILLDPGQVPEGESAWWSGRGNDFGCSPVGGHNLDLWLPELEALPGGTPITLEFKSSWDIEWDWDYGFVLAGTNDRSLTSQPSQNGYTTAKSYNPNKIGCLNELDNGITGTSGAWQQGQPFVTAARVPNANDYSAGGPFLQDSYDISELAGQRDARVRFSYFTDGAFDRPGWFIDEVVVKAGGQVIYSSEDEDGQEGRLEPDGWRPVTSETISEADHAYYLELRDQSGFDFDGHGQSDRGDTTWDPGVLIEYTDEAHGYGNSGNMEPPAQHYIDSAPVPGTDCAGGNCADSSFTAASGDSHFDDHVDAEQPQGFINNFTDPDSAYGDNQWHFDYGCLTVDITSMSGEGVGPESPARGDISAEAVISAGEGCAPFTYGRGGVNGAPTAEAQARPTDATVGQTVTFDGSRSTDDVTPTGDLEYAWDLGDGTTAAGQTVHHAYDEPGEYVATLTVTDEEGATDSDMVTISVTGVPDLTVSSVTTAAGTGTAGSKPKAGDKVVIRATISNVGSAAAAATSTSFTLDGVALPNSPVATGAIPAGGSVTVELAWDTRGVSGEHVIGVVADSGGVVAEAREGNNSGTLSVSVRGNKVTNGDFEQSNDAETGPAAWTGTSTGAGTTSYSEDGGSDGSSGASMSGTGGNAALAGVPTWTSSPVAVKPGELLDLRVLVSSAGMSSAPSVGLAYLGSAGKVLDTVRLLQVPLVTDGFATLEKSVTVPKGVTEVRIVLSGFAATDLATAGTVTFDDVGLYGP